MMLPVSRPSTGQEIVIIEGAAHAFGGSYQGKKIGRFRDATCFTCGPIKNLTCGDGGRLHFLMILSLN